MTVISRDLFYTRKLQLRFSLKKNNNIYFLFLIEKILFNLYSKNVDIFFSNLKLKWIYDQIDGEEIVNMNSLSFLEFKDKSLKKNLLDLLDSFSEVLSAENKFNFINCFKRFNKTFNLIIKLNNEDFQTSLDFQILMFFYENDHPFEESVKKTIELKKNKIDIFEKVFVDLYYKNYNVNKFKISKKLYLYKIFLHLLLKK